MTDERFRLLVGAGVGVVSIIGVVVLLALRVEVTTIVTAFAAVGSLVGLFVLNEVQKVKTQTNGNMQWMQKLLSEHVKNSTPVKKGDDDGSV